MIIRQTIAILLCVTLPVSAGAPNVFTEAYVQPGGSALNAGAKASADTGGVDDAATFTYASGSWVQSTGIFTVASGNPLTDGVAVDDFASVYADGSTATGFVGRVTARTSTTITVDTLTKKSGTAPADGSGNRTLKIGGAWPLTPSFPIGFVQASMTNAAGDVLRINIKDGTVYTFTAAGGGMTNGNPGPMWIQGYHLVPGDCENAPATRPIIDGGTTGASYTVLTNTQNYVHIAQIEFRNNGNSGAADLVSNSGNACLLWQVTVHDARRCGYRSTANTTCVESEAYACNGSNTPGFGGFSFATSGSSITRTISHSHIGTNGNGFILDTSLNFVNNIIANCGGDGCQSNGDVNQNFYSSTFTGNTGAGFKFTGGSQTMQSSFHNCLFTANGGYGVEFRAPGHGGGLLMNCAFGAGTQANGGASNGGKYNNVTPLGVQEIGTITLPTNTSPYVNASTGDYRLNIPQVKGTGRGFFMITKPGFGVNTASAPDVGAVQGRSFGEKAATFVQ